MKDLSVIKKIQQDNITFRIRKTCNNPDLKSHMILTDDQFTYVDFYFKKYPKKITLKSGEKIPQNHTFYWEQSRNFYHAAKLLPIEAAPLPMYYSMLNAAKSYILYRTKDIDKAIVSLCRHGIKESKPNDQKTSTCAKNLADISIKRENRGVFPFFSEMIDPRFSTMWSNNWEPTIKMLLEAVPFVHSAYITTYDLRKKRERFIPLKNGEPPTFVLCNDHKVHLEVELEKQYFSDSATNLPEEIKKQTAGSFTIDRLNSFRLISTDGFLKKEIRERYPIFRKLFTYISADQKLWYLKKLTTEDTAMQINDMSLMLAFMHRFSEIVRYKPEQMIELLKGKENWVIHEFITLALDQFIDRITAEITKKEIMPTRHST